MVEFDLKWRDKDISDFVLFYTLKKSRWQRLLLSFFLILLVLSAVFSIVVFFITEEVKLLLGFGLCVVMMAVYIFLFFFISRGMSKELTESNIENRDISAVFSEEMILLKREKKPIGAINWDDIGEIHIEKKAAYILGKSNALILVSYDDITIGTIEEFKTLLTGKKAKIVKTEKESKQ